MRLLLASATLFEIRPFLETIGALDEDVQKSLPAGATVALPAFGRWEGGTALITGVGQAIAAFHIGVELSKGYDAALQAGLAGSFSSEFGKRAVVRVASEVFADLGAENNGDYLSLDQMGFLDPDVPPFQNGRLLPIVGNGFEGFSHLPAVASVTVNRVLSQPASIQWVEARYSPVVVNMEGASFLYATAISRVPSVELRAVSDLVGPRDKASWDITGAVTSLNEVLIHWSRSL